MTIEDRNYYGDRRVRFRAPRHEGWTLDEKRQVAIVPLPELEDDGRGEDAEFASERDEGIAPEDRDEESYQRTTIEIPFAWAVCGICQGRGRHVNPAIDAGGLSREDFDEDPDFAEGYFSGRYDVTCSECNGRRVVPELTPRTEAERDAIRALDAQEEDDAAYERECRAERMMGA
jgi:hypothetical protein